jgi:hypothetical protein
LVIGDNYNGIGQPVADAAPPVEEEPTPRTATDTDCIY